MTAQPNTIAALSTPPGTGGVGVLRLSGPEALPIVKKCFRPLGHKALEEHPPRTLVYGELLDSGGQAVDRVLCTYSRAPRSYTGEDTAELHCHGAPMVLSLGLEALFAAGARQAGPGEFTRRAFLNGKLDLAQAEAVGDLLEAGSREGARNAYGQLAGALSRRVETVYDGLTDVLAHFHAVLDYPDEDIDPFTERTVREALETALARLDALLATCARGSMLTEGAPCAIVGRPNVGKSSLLNVLLGYDRAIVTEVPGTTRDTLEERVRLGGVLLRLVDTAGLRETGDAVERLGVERSREAMERSRLILAVLDLSRPLEPEDTALTRQAADLAPTVLVLNKADLPRRLELPSELDDLPRVTVSAKTGQGLEELAERVAGLFPDRGDEAGSLLTNARQAEAAARAREGVRRALEALEAGVTPDALLTDVEEAMAALGELTGRSVSQDVTDRVFSRFCVGK